MSRASLTVILSLFAAISGSAQISWERLAGPNGTYYVQSITEDVVGSKLWASTPNGGGIYVSTNQGDSWSLKVNGLPPNTSIPDVAVGPGGALYTIAGKIYKSPTGGDSWIEMTASPAVLTSLHITQTGVVFGGSENAAGGVGIYRSNDAGASWAPANTGLPSYAIGPFTYYRSVSSISSDGSGILYCTVNSGSTTEAGVYKSVDNGGSWTRMSSGLLANINVKPVRVGPGGTLYAGVRNRVYRSIDGAATWTPTDSIPMLSSLLLRHIEFDGSGQLFASTSGGTFRATAAGTGWTSIANPYSAAQDFLITSSGAYISCGWDANGTSGGIQKSTNGGVSWNASNAGMNNAYTSALTVTPTGGIFNGLAGGGRMDYSHDNGQTFTRVALPYTGQFAFGSIVAVLGKAASTVVAGTLEGVHTSSDHGATWTKTSTVASRALALDGSANFLAGGGSGVLRSTNNGQSWTSLGGGGNVYSLLVTRAGTILAGTFNAGINRSTDGGSTWSNSGTSLFGNITIGRFVQLSNTNIFVHTLGGIFRSTDDGATWATVNGTPIGVQYRTLAGIGGILLLGTPSGLYQSTDGGTTWINYSSGLLNTTLDYLALGPDGRLYGSGGSGIYRTTTPIITSIGTQGEDLPDEFHLYQNYPNPFNPTTTISFQIPEAGHVSVRIFDVTGREVVTLIDEKLAAGVYEKRFDASGLASGVFFCRLQSGNSSMTRKLVLIR